MKQYNNRIFNDYNQFLSDVPNNSDRISMKKELSPLIYEMQKYNINSPYNFVDIMMRFNLPREVIAEFLKKMNDVLLSNRLISKTNAFEKNTILTYYSLVEPQKMMNKFKEYVKEKYPYFRNKENLFTEINKEIIKIKDKITEANENSDSDGFENLYDSPGSPDTMEQFSIIDETEIHNDVFDFDGIEPFDNFNEDIFGVGLY